MEAFINKLRKDFTHLTFQETGQASWSPHSGQISYATKGERDIWSTLHELGHALLGHSSYESDIDLLRKETEAWDKARILGKQYRIDISEDHIQNCLDTYRDWLHKRSRCPTCGNHGLQRSKAVYCCLNCQGTWKVSSARFCRPYRLRSGQNA